MLSWLIINAYEIFLPTHFEQAVLIAQLNVDYVIQLDMKYSSTTKEEARERVKARATTMVAFDVEGNGTWPETVR